MLLRSNSALERAGDQVVSIQFTAGRRSGAEVMNQIEVRRMRAIVLMITSSIFAVAHAGQQSGQILSIRVSSTILSSNPTHVLISGTSLNRPVCATLQYWAIDS